MENLALWRAVEKTPLNQTKPITGKAYKGTSPKPHYLVQKATETFGPCGIGWGFTVDERIEDGHQPGIRMHIAKVRVWYIWDDKRGEVEHIGGTVFSGVNRNGPFTDEDAPKKSVTDALVKALSMIGFAGDIFMGRYDDSKYVADLRDEADGKAHPQQPKTHTAGGITQMHPRTVVDGRQKSSSQAKKDKDHELIKSMEECESAASLDAWMRANRDLLELLPANWQNEIHERWDAARAEFVKAEATDTKSPAHKQLEESVNVLGAG